jgi:hypothetical protein
LHGAADGSCACIEDGSRRFLRAAQRDEGQMY